MKIIYAFYIDVFYLRTFIVNSMGMICITYVLKIPLYGRIRRIILAGAASGMVSCLLLLFGGYSIYRWLSLFVVAPAAVYFATDARIGMIKLFGLSVFVTVLSGGVVYALDSLLSADTSLICTGGFVITYMILKSWCECSNESRGLYRVTIMEKEKKVYVTALYDSGNLLKKQPENVPVHIAKASVFDITGDDKITIADVSLLYRHVRKTKVIEDSETLEVSDLTGDGKITIADVAKLYRYVRGKIKKF